jgi:hypothetical protein
MFHIMTFYPVPLQEHTHYYSYELEPYARPFEKETSRENCKHTQAQRINTHTHTHTYNKAI